MDFVIYDNGSLTTVYLVDKNIYGQSQEPSLIVRGQRIPIRGGKVRLQAEKGRHRTHLSSLDKKIRRVLLDGKAHSLTAEAEGGASLECHLDGTQELMVVAA